MLDGLVVDESDMADTAVLSVGTAVSRTLMQSADDRRRVAEVTLRLVELILDQQI